ncbi:hypothetical protein ES703_11882 [subsurface metagenome]
MSIIRVVKNKHNPYLIMNKTGLNDKRLSLKAKGLLCYLLSKPDNWYINTKDIIANNDNARASVFSAINELVRFGYMFKHQFRNQNGSFHSYNYLVYEHPLKSLSEKTITYPQADFPHAVNPHPDNQHLLINNKEVINKDPLTTLSNKPNERNVAQDDLCLKESKEYTIQLLNELYIKNHKILFDSFDDSDIFYYADWMLTFKSRIKNPTGFMIAALKGRWLDVAKFYNLPEGFYKDSDKCPK